MKPCFVTFEGIEGSGKTLQLQMLEADLRGRGVPFLLTREPGGTAFGEQVRSILLRHDGVTREPLAELLLYLADRYQHLHQVVEPALAQGLHVFSDRYHDATVVYQGLARGIGFAKVKRLAEVLELRTPDLTLVLDLPVEAGLERARRRDSKDENQQWGRFEAESRAFHDRVREGYHLLANQEPERVVLVDAAGQPREVFARILKLLAARGIRTGPPPRERPPGAAGAEPANKSS